MQQISRIPRPSKTSAESLAVSATASATTTGDSGSFLTRGLRKIGNAFKELVIHDDDDHDDGMEITHVSDSENVRRAQRVIWMGIFGDIVLTAVKAVMGTLAKSPALLADALHSLSDIVGHFVTLICVKLARRPSNEVFPYGFGKFETVGSLAVAFLMIGAGVELIRESVAIMLAPAVVNAAPPQLQIAAGITAAAAVGIKELLFQLTAREGRKQGSPMLGTAAWHHRSDAMSSGVALVGIAASLMGISWADPFAGSLVAALVLSVGLQIAWKSVKELMDMSVPAEVREKLQNLVEEASSSAFDGLDADKNGQISKDEWVSKYGTNDGFEAFDTDGNGYIDLKEWNQNRLRVCSVRARKMGPHLMLDVDMDVPPGARFIEIQKAQDKMLKHIHSSNPRVREIRFQLTTTRSCVEDDATEPQRNTGYKVVSPS